MSMAMSSKPQLLIHDGELNQIVGMIKAAKSPEVKLGGSLFGLWRNSLTQPVVYLVTGPGKNAKVRKSAFAPDVCYHSRCKEHLKENHGLLQIGLWLSGSARRYPKFDPHNVDFRVRIETMPDKGKYAVLLFVNTVPSLSMDFFIVDRNNPKSFTFNRLHREDVLPGHSCFRLLKPISKEVKHGAMFSSKDIQEKHYFSRHELPSSNEAHRPVHDGSEEQQWYESDDGGTLLVKLLNAFERNAVSVEMSRNAKTHDMTFELNGKLCLNFPREFPKEEPSLSWTSDRRVRHLGNHDETCQRIVNGAMRVLHAF